MKIILASASQRRRELMAQAGYTFTVHPASAEEVIEGNHPSEVVENLSKQKALWVTEELCRQEEGPETEEGEFLVIGADTVVSAEGEILGKPADHEEATHMIEMLQGKIHQVYTGVTLVLVKDKKIVRTRTFHECTDVDVYEMSQEEIRDYVSTPEPYDKAGAYGIQGGFGVYIRGIRGCYYNVVGLPIARLRHELKDYL